MHPDMGSRETAAPIAYKDLQSLAKYREQYVRYNSHHVFLNKCITMGLIPQGMLFRFGTEALPKCNALIHSVKDMILFASKETLANCRDTYASLSKTAELSMHETLYKIQQELDYQQFDKVVLKHKAIMNAQSRKQNHNKKRKLEKLLKNKQPVATPSCAVPPTSKKRRNRRFKRRLPQPQGAQTDDNANVVNLSTVNLSDEQKSILTLGPKFCPTPMSLDSNRLEEDVKEGCRRTRLREFHLDKQDATNPIGPPKFYRKTGFCPHSGRDKALDAFCHLIEHRVGAYTHNKLKRPRDNLTTKQRKALAELKQLVKSRRIRISTADKGGATVVQDTEDYIAEAKQQLSNTKHYVPINSDPTPQIAKKSNDITDKLLADGHISEQTHRWAKLTVSSTRCHRFYTLPKIHKTLDHPPGRPIVSGVQGPTENLSKLVDSWLQDYVTELPSHIKDSTHMLKTIEEWNRNLGPFPENTKLVTIDVTALYTNIPHDNLKTALRHYLSENPKPDTTPTVQVVIDVAEHVLTNNVFMFEDQIYKQVSGTAMGTPLAPSAANLFMGWLEQQLLQHSPVSINKETWKRFIDDIFMLFCGTDEELMQFTTFINQFHPTIKFTVNSSDQSVPFLDINISLKDGFLQTDLYSKPTDSHAYLFSTSCHPRHTINNIPYSLFIRLRRLCSTPEAYKARCEELTEQLKKRGHSSRTICAAKQKADNQTRSQCLEYRKKDNSTRVPFIVTHNPQNPPLRQWLTELHETMVRDSDRMKRAVPERPVVGERKALSLRQALMPTNLPDKPDPRPPGNHTCGATRCVMCRKHLVTDNHFTSHQTGETFSHRHAFSCTSSNIIYVLWCNKCQHSQYVGETQNSIKKRFYKHYEDIRGDSGTLVTQHFNQADHGLPDLKCMVIEQILSPAADVRGRRRREYFWMTKLRTIYPLGLNSKE